MEDPIDYAIRRFAWQRQKWEWLAMLIAAILLIALYFVLSAVSVK